MAKTITLPELVIPEGEMFSNAIPAPVLNTARSLLLVPVSAGEWIVQVTADGSHWADWWEPQTAIASTNYESEVNQRQAITISNFAAKGVRIRSAGVSQETGEPMPHPYPIRVSVCVYDPYA